MHGETKNSRGHLTLKSNSRVISVVLAATLTVGLSACTFGPDARAKHQETPSPAPSGIYSIDHFDACSRTDTKLLGSLATKTVKIEPDGEKSKTTVLASTCVFDMRDLGGDEVTLDITMVRMRSIENNRKWHREDRFKSHLIGLRDYTIKGIGDEAYGKSYGREDMSRNWLQAIQGNLRLQVILTIYQPNVPWSTVAPKLRAIAQDLLDAATKD